MKAIKNNYKHYFDLYGSEIFIAMLKNAFKNVCYCDKAIPGAGSPVQNSRAVREDLTIKKAIFHHNNEITILTDKGNLRFF